MPPDDIETPQEPNSPQETPNTDARYEERFNSIETQLSHVQNAVAELASARGTANARHRTQPSSAARTQAETVQPSQPTPPSEPEPERAPKPAHRYWRKLWGN